jgi:crotonobetainyl-CoA:carnitine CoA-transferase CaiB-like acyl-CoA transferase
MAHALEDLLILDFSRVLAGPLATMVLADLGATVVKVERPGAGDDTRAWGPPYDAAGVATYFLSVNRNKRSVALDLRNAHDVAVARELASRADVVVENFRPGVMERLGLGYDELAQANAGLVYCSITGFGRAGGAHMPGYDLLVQAAGGLMSVTGPAGGEPQKVGVALVDVMAGLFAAVGVLSALRHRDRTGEGQRVDVDLLSSLLAGMANQASAYTAGGVVPGRLGNMHPSIAPYELLPADGGDLVLACGTDRQFAAVCDVLGLPGLAEDPDFATNDRRVAHRDRLRATLIERLATRTPGAWAADLIAAGVPAGEVNDMASAIALARSLGLEPTVALEREDGSTVDVVRNPIGLSATPPAYWRAPPSLGADDDDFTTASSAPGER